MNLPTATPSARFAILQAKGRGIRASETLNAGVVLFTSQGVRVSVVTDARRLSWLHPDYAAVALEGWAAAVETSVNRLLGPAGQASDVLAALPLFCGPFEVSPHLGSTELLDADATLDRLMACFVELPKRTLGPARRPKKKSTRLHAEIRRWLQISRVFSSRVEDLSKGKVVSNYPIDPAADLYADFAVMNGKVNAIETLDLHGLDRLTAGLRGEAALKGITLDGARERIDGKRIVVLSVSDYGVMRPAIQLVSRYADDVLDMQVQQDREALARFISSALHTPELPELMLHR